MGGNLKHKVDTKWGTAQIFTQNHDDFIRELHIYNQKTALQTGGVEFRKKEMVVYEAGTV